MTLPSWFVLAGAVTVVAALAVLVYRNHHERHRAERQLADDVEAWLREHCEKRAP